MRVFSVQSKVLPGLLNGKSLPKEILKAGAAAITAAGAIADAEAKQSPNTKQNWDGCGCEDWCTALLSF